METLQKTTNGVDLNRLHATIKAIGENPAIADFKFRASNKWVDGANNVSSIKGFYGACQEDTSRDVNLVLEADEPDVLLGTNNGPNPTETLLHALAACITTTLVYHAAAKGIQLKRVASTYEGDLDLHGFLALDLNVDPGYKVIRITFDIEGEKKLSDRQKQRLLDVGRQFSPVHSMVSKAVPMEVLLK
ncbi:OsmC family protein [Aestuariivivens sediminis]|uniref:OsmC family protein n=1 Tax=Aestuariivivens sediminis TaxID=2913557 RepID=UPI001F562ACB|nr:OsmC family protein [Aestuariivivens sediminis]